jgi:putative FmdB family regulatory protein
MPEYQYECKNCDNSFDIVESIKADAQTLCTKCGCETLFRVIFAPINSRFNNEVNTVGQLADRNWKKMGHYEREAKLIKDKVPETIAKKEKAARLNKIAKMTPEQQQRWVQEGD